MACGLLEDEARKLNEAYCRWIVTGRPFVTVKLAMTLDGQIATAGGASRWISGPAARAAVHRMRARADAVLVGGETLRADDPLLTARIPGAREPRRVVVTSRLRDLAGARLFGKGGGEVIVVCPRGAPHGDLARIAGLGARIVPLPARRGRIGAGRLLDALGGLGIASLFVEGGGRTAGWLAAEGAVDRFVFFIAPRLLGEGVRAFAGFATRRVEEGRRLTVSSVRRIGDDLMVVAEPVDPGKG